MTGLDRDALVRQVDELGDAAGRVDGGLHGALVRQLGRDGRAFNGLTGEVHYVDHQQPVTGPDQRIRRHQAALRVPGTQDQLVEPPGHDVAGGDDPPRQRHVGRWELGVVEQDRDVARLGREIRAVEHEEDGAVGGVEAVLGDALDPNDGLGVDDGRRSDGVRRRNGSVVGGRRLGLRGRLGDGNGGQRQQAGDLDRRGESAPSWAMDGLVH